MIMIVCGRGHIMMCVREHVPERGGGGEGGQRATERGVIHRECRISYYSST